MQRLTPIISASLSRVSLPPLTGTHFSCLYHSLTHVSSLPRVPYPPALGVNFSSLSSSTDRPIKDDSQDSDKEKLKALDKGKPKALDIPSSSSTSSSQSASVTSADKPAMTESLESRPAERLFDEFWKGYNERNSDVIKKLCLPDVFMWGSADGEDLDGSDALVKQVRDDWLKSEKARMDVRHHIPSPPGAQWAAALCDLTFWIKNDKGVLEKHVLKNYRCTFTVGKDKDASWKIAHIHGSLPDARNLDNMSTPEVRSK